MGICFTFSSVEALHLEDVFSLHLTLHLNKQISILSFKLLGIALDMITIFIKKGENLARQIASKDSMIMNLGKSAASVSESDSDKFLFHFFY